MILQEEDEDAIRRAHDEFCARWGLPTRYTPVRPDIFGWLGIISSDDRNRFMVNLSEILTSLSVTGHAFIALVPALVIEPGFERENTTQEQNPRRR